MRGRELFDGAPEGANGGGYFEYSYCKACRGLLGTNKLIVGVSIP